ncbi:hypothetical protein SODALDRAFT_328436 [Sodiomyces alkalinus F11]|uniref:Uncharacterized protein n=1 Tax=Sodiomyces alkalinus (strain CBS 110278 / VKM F-3762 / F11) TaxID=1314773 RepID=A0A3N2PNE1_SODAK|nr:hypothetical protein SODALDRAFT_328436 [Sodiomyces alkalinus F11]ROT36051.1 hypothetical protein SODALDRAFT_328436 [Sodiomyces alkalinus F11]
MRGKDDPDFAWMERMLRGFLFREVGRTDSSHRTRRGMNSEWLNKHIWQHQASIEEYPAESDPGAWEGGLAWSRSKHLMMRGMRLSTGGAEEKSKESQDEANGGRMH